MAKLTLNQKRELRARLLRHFAQPKLNRFISEEPIFADGAFAHNQIQETIRCLETVGLLHIVRGVSSGSIYVCSDDGQILLDAMEIAMANQKDGGQ